MKAKLEKELEHLQADNSTPVQFSEWVAPIIPVVKQDRSISVCGDYKLTVNQSSHLECYLLLHVENIFSALSGGKPSQN